MQPRVLLSKIVSSLFFWTKPKTMTIKVKSGDTWVEVDVPNGSTFSYFSEKFGEGNWAL